MDGKELLSQSDLSYYAHQQQQQQQQHRMLGGGGGAGHSASPLAGMHGGPSVIRPMPNMGMSPTAILQSIGGGPLAGMQFQMDAAPPSLLHNSMGSVSASAGSPTVPAAQGAATPMEPVKRKRGRPRKYGPDGTMKVSAAAVAAQQQMMSAPPRMGSMSGADMVGSSAGMDDAAQKKRRGRPPGTGKKQQLSSPVKLSGGNAFSGSAGTSFTPHIITASPSEDVAGKIVAFANHSSRAVCVLSATGSVSRVVLRHPADGAAAAMSRVHGSSPYKNPAIYEGLYEILSISGCYNLMNEGQSDGLSVTLCSPERHIIGGVLGGALVAASPVQVVLGTFVQGGSKPKSKKAGKQQQQQAAAAFSSDSLTGGQDASPSSGHNQNLTPAPPVTTGGWPSSGIFDTRSSNIDINSSRG
ncbi:AT-hook motif nuclear-localized protein 9-like [Oryza brachyantha]|uniref:AT-hook motif nuclear-localized protein 9-like n=1 Tax=Oryza brachyantha TaxID=4533 RepID=UPI001ADCB9A4|nr:AT-hook motif nuclear-localized protein 9-like [Oryza brachyantha]